MQLGKNSRYQYCHAFRDEGGRLFLDEREPFAYRDEKDNRLHTVIEGDSWWGLAFQYFQGLDRPEGLWWLLCEYQPLPVVDPTIKLPEGTLVVIPSLRLVRLEVFSDGQRRYH
jgi:hypothetical protein